MPETRRWLDGLTRAERAELLAWVWNTQDEGAVLLDGRRRVLDVNRAACTMLGATRDELVGTPVDDPPRPIDGVRVAAHERGTDAAGGRLTLLTLTDVGHEDRARQAVERLAESLESFRAIVDESGSAIALLDPDWRVRWMNPAGLALTGLDAASAPGTPYLELVGDAARIEHLNVERDAVAREGRWTGASVLLPADRSRRPVPVEGTSYLIEHPATGEPLGIACIRRDVSATRRLAREHEAIGTLATTIASGVGREAIYETACREAARLLDADAGAIAALGAEGARIVGAWRSGGADDRLQRAVGRLSTDLPADGGSCAVGVGDGHHCVGAAVLVDGAPWGLIVACRVGEPFSGEDERALRGLGGLVGTAVGVVRSRELLVRQATTDGLTGLRNHREFHDRLRAEVARAQRYGRPVGVVVVDLDGFKGVNDRHGHHEGDRLLKAVAGVLSAAVRGSEVVGRLGGDEFALLLPETDLAGAHATAERVHAAIAALPETARHGVTASSGVAELAQAPSGEALVRLADRAMYWSKVDGRNRVSDYDETRPEPPPGR